MVNFNVTLNLCHACYIKDFRQKEQDKNSKKIEAGKQKKNNIDEDVSDSREDGIDALLNSDIKKVKIIEEDLLSLSNAEKISFEEEQILLEGRCKLAEIPLFLLEDDYDEDVCYKHYESKYDEQQAKTRQEGINTLRDSVYEEIETLRENVSNLNFSPERTRKVIEWGFDKANIPLIFLDGDEDEKNNHLENLYDDNQLESNYTSTTQAAGGASMS